MAQLYGRQAISLKIDGEETQGGLQSSGLHYTANLDKYFSIPVDIDNFLAIPNRRPPDLRR